jgi:hypothetical protein
MHKTGGLPLAQALAPSRGRTLRQGLFLRLLGRSDAVFQTQSLTPTETRRSLGLEWDGCRRPSPGHSSLQRTKVTVLLRRARGPREPVLRSLFGQDAAWTRGPHETGKAPWLAGKAFETREGAEPISCWPMHRALLRRTETTSDGQWLISCQLCPQGHKVFVDRIPEAT